MDNFSYIKFWVSPPWFLAGWLYIILIVLIFSFILPHWQGVAGTASGSVWYINWAEESRVRLVSGHAGQVTGAATTSDGLQLATCCRGGLVAMWSMENLEQTAVFQTPNKVHCLVNSLVYLCLWILVGEGNFLSFFLCFSIMPGMLYIIISCIFM